MAKQLIFCSVPHGLQPGRSGYCLMAGHTDMPQSLIRQLEQETSVFPANENEDHPPTHEVRKTGDTEWHLFIRQTTGIKDYTGRSSGLTHVIAERAEDYPEKLDPKTVLWKFKSWVTAIPDTPKAYGSSEVVLLENMMLMHPGEHPAKINNLADSETEAEEDIFKLNPDANRPRPTPQPRSGMYYDGKRKKSRLGWWIGLAVILVALVIVLIL
jgi:hypothetical protein